MKIIKLNTIDNKEIIDQTIKTLEKGSLVVFPTDTVYGLLADSTNPLAIDKLLAFKDRPVGKAISVFVSDENMAKRYIITNPNSTNIFKNLLPGPFTIVCQSSSRAHSTSSVQATSRDPFPVSGERDSSMRPDVHRDLVGMTNDTLDPRLLAENGTLGIRLPDYPLITQLVHQYGKPLTATSANLSGTPPHHSIDSFLKFLNFTRSPLARQGETLKNSHNISKGKKIDLINLIIDAGNLPKNKPSTVIDTTSGSLKTLRLGDLLPNTPNSLLSKSENETRKLAGFILSKALKNSSGRPIVFLLQGELGAGKTIFTKGLGKILGVKEEIISPTYTICYEYKIDTAVSSRAHSTSSVQATSRDPFPSDFSTKNPDLSTGYPIGNGIGSDIEGHDRNIDYVDQEAKTCIMNYVLCIKGKQNEKIPQNSKFKIQNTFLVHYDLYRIESPEDLKEIKFLESIVSGNIYSIEWPERIDENTLSKLKEVAQIIYITIKHMDEVTREIKWS